MAKHSPKQVVESFWRTFAARRLAQAFAEHMAADCEMLLPGGPPLQGEAQIRGMFEAYVSAFPDFSAETIHAIEAGDTYAAETRFAGTHRGPLLSAQGSIPATGRRVSWQSADVVRVRGDKIVSWHVYHDTLPLLVQLGVAVG